VFVAVNAPLRLLIADAYVGPQPGAIDRILGGPEWLQSARYDINAKSAGSGDRRRWDRRRPAPQPIPRCRRS
jgi:uncharacterized protein (TIGR03435 family)